MNICTVEDPVEYNLPRRQPVPGQREDRLHLRQRPCGRCCGRTRTSIMVGEIRDEETARIAVQAALTGHLVLQHAAHQRRPRRRHAADQHRRRAVPGRRRRRRRAGPAAGAEDLPQLQGAATSRRSTSAARSSRSPGEVETFYRGAGCPKCRNTGYRGRIGIYELLVPDDDMRDKITAAPSINELRALAAESGMVTPARRTAWSRSRPASPRWRRSSGPRQADSIADCGLRIADCESKAHPPEGRNAEWPTTHTRFVNPAGPPSPG